MLAWHSGSDPLRCYGRGRRGRAGWRWRAARRPRQLSVDGVAGSRSSASRGNAAGLVRPRPIGSRAFIRRLLPIITARSKASIEQRKEDRRTLPRASRTSESPHRRYRSSVTPQRTSRRILDFGVVLFVALGVLRLVAGLPGWAAIVIPALVPGGWRVLPNGPIAEDHLSPGASQSAESGDAAPVRRSITVLRMRPQVRGRGASSTVRWSAPPDSTCIRDSPGISPPALPVARQVSKSRASAFVIWASPGRTSASATSR